MQFSGGALRINESEQHCAADVDSGRGKIGPTLYSGSRVRIRS